MLEEERRHLIDGHPRDATGPVDQVGVGEETRHLRLALAEGGEGRRRRVEEVHDDPVEERPHLGIATPVVGIALHYHTVPGHALYESERPSSHGVKRHVLIAVFLDGCWAHHRYHSGAEICQSQQEGIERLLQGYLDRVWSDNVDLIEEVYICGPIRFGARIEIFEILLPKPFEVELDRLSIKRRSVMELDAFAQCEGILKTVRRNLPA